MKRIIKFRVWDNGLKGYAPISCVFGFTLDHTESNITLGNKKDHEEIIVEQFTGLKDKNGIEIYEGDTFLDKHHGLSVVEYSESNASFMMIILKDKRLGCPLHHTNRSNIEIIGNIHEVNNDN